MIQSNAQFHSILFTIPYTGQVYLELNTLNQDGGVGEVGDGREGRRGEEREGGQVLHSAMD